MPDLRTSLVVGWAFVWRYLAIVIVLRAAVFLLWLAVASFWWGEEGEAPAEFDFESAARVYSLTVTFLKVSTQLLASAAAIALLLDRRLGTVVIAIEAEHPGRTFGRVMRVWGRFLGQLLVPFIFVGAVAFLLGLLVGGSGGGAQEGLVKMIEWAAAAVVLALVVRALGRTLYHNYGDFSVVLCNPPPAPGCGGSVVPRGDLGNGAENTIENQVERRCRPVLNRVDRCEQRPPKRRSKG